MKATDTAHAKLSPSKATRWSTCTGSIALEDRYPQEDSSSVYADEGTAAHELGASALLSKDQVDCDSYVGIDIKVRNEDGTVRRTFTVDDEMAEYVQVYVDEIRRRAEGNQLLVEQRVDYSQYIQVDDQTGTADAIVLNYEDNVLEVHDLKYGRGVRVDAERNKQMMLYALGAYYEYEMLADWEAVRVFVHQPRLDHLDEYEIEIVDLMEFAETMKLAAQAIELGYLDGKPLLPDELMDMGLLAPSPEACRWCPVKEYCPAMREEVHAEVFDDFEDLDAKDPETMEIDELPQPEILELIEIYLKAVRARIQNEALAGHKVKGWKLVAGRRGARKWIKDQVEEAAKKLKNMRFKHDEIYKKELISPTQAMKLVKGDKRREKILAEFITQAEGGHSVAPESDKRPAIDITPVEEDFDNLEERNG